MELEVPSESFKGSLTDLPSYLTESCAWREETRNREHKAYIRILFKPGFYHPKYTNHTVMDDLSAQEILNDTGDFSGTGLLLFYKP
jgi:hypothetical protein